MNKRGQFYIIIAVIISLAIFSINSESNKIESVTSYHDFPKLSENYVDEAERVVDYSIYNSQDANKKLNEFSSDFLKYARKTNPSLSLIYIYSNESNLNLRSYLNETTIVNSSDRSMSVLFGAGADTINDVSLRIGGKTFTHQVPMKIQNYGDEFSSAQFSTPEWLSLNVAGVFHNFDLSDGGPLLNVIIKANNGERVEVYSTGSNSASDAYG